METHELTDAEKKANELALKEALEEIEWGKQRPERFLAAWKRGVKLAGEGFFDVQGNVDLATDKNQLKPKWDVIKNNLHQISSGESAFLVALYQFYNASDGKELAEAIDCTTLRDISVCLDKKRLEVIAELFINDGGWV